jgi:predicted O-methyltransferase YrrM
MRALNWLNEAEFTVEGISFRCCVNDYTQKTTNERFILLKDRETLEQYASVLANDEPRNALEFGIFQGGSAALFTAWFGLEKFVGIDICGSIGPFDDFCRTHEVGKKIRSYYGVSQTDAARVREIAQSEFGDTPIDLIIDDASHAYRHTRRTFEIAFPLLRPGGTYVVEDWGWGHWSGHHTREGETALSMLIMELIMVCASRPDLVSNIQVFPAFAFIHKSASAPPMSEAPLESLYRKQGIELIGVKNLNLKGVADLVGQRLTHNARRELQRLRRRVRGS